VEKGIISDVKEILFLPPPEEAVVNLETHFRDEGVRFTWVGGYQELSDRLKTVPPFLVVLDLSRLDPSVFKVLPKIHDSLGDCRTIIFGQDNHPQTLKAEPLREIVFFQHLLEASALSTALERILRDGWAFFKRNSMGKNPYHLLFCHSKKMEGIRAVIDQVAPTHIIPLIQGESGTGKELVARAIHFMSLRRNKPLIKVNCAALPGELLESEIFGLEKGLSEGACTRKPGKLELANEGTLLFDEIGDLDVSLQARLIKVLRDREFSRLGGTGSIAVDTRLIACTKSDLRSAVEAGRFREDLYYCLNVVNITVPPLRERKEEIPSLTRYFLDLYNCHYGRSHPGISKETKGVFLSYDWPGNIRQLQNAVKRIVVFNDEALVVREVLEKQPATSDTAAPVPHLSEPLEQSGGNLKHVGRRAAKDAERVTIQKMLEQTRWNRREAAELLQISYKALLYKIKEYGLDQ